MTTKTKQDTKEFDAVAFMRKQRDKISKDISNMNFKEIKAYFAKKRAARGQSNIKSQHSL